MAYLNVTSLSAWADEDDIFVSVTVKAPRGADATTRSITDKVCEAFDLAFDLGSRDTAEAKAELTERPGRRGGATPTVDTPAAEEPVQGRRGGRRGATTEPTPAAEKPAEEPVRRRRQVQEEAGITLEDMTKAASSAAAEMDKAGVKDAATVVVEVVELFFTEGGEKGKPCTSVGQIIKEEREDFLKSLRDNVKEEIAKVGK